MIRRLRRPGRAPLGALALTALLGTACASTSLTSVWRSEAHPGGLFRSLLVMSLSEQPGLRAAYEERLAARLEAHGVRAVAGAPAPPEPGALDRETARRLARELGVDGVLATHQVRVRSELQVIRRGDPFWLFPELGPYYGDVSVRETETLVLETNLYDAEGRLVWSAVSETWEPADRDVLVAEVTKLVTEALVREGLLPGVEGTEDAEAGGRDQAFAGASSGAAVPSARGRSTVNVVPSPSFDAT